MTKWTGLISGRYWLWGEVSTPRQKKAHGPIIMLNCIQPQGWNESDFFLARTGLLGLTASKSVRASSFLWSACNFSNLCVVVNGVWCLQQPFTLMKASRVGQNRQRMKKIYCFALHFWYWIYSIMKRRSLSKCLWYVIYMVTTTPKALFAWP